MIPVRSFLALPIPEAVQGYLSALATPILDNRDKINWVNPGNIHITLSFLGEADPACFEEQATQIAMLVARHSGFDLGTTGTGVFPHANDPHVLWVGAAPYDNRLLTFKADLDNLLKHYGYTIDYRKFQPHITLGRVKSISRKSSFIHDYLIRDVREMIFPIQEVKWLQSTLTPEGAEYEEIYNFKFKQGETA